MSLIIQFKAHNQNEITPQQSEKHIKVFVTDKMCLVGNKMLLVGNKTYLVTGKMYLVADKTYLVSDKTCLVSDKTYFVTRKMQFVGNKTSLVTRFQFFWLSSSFFDGFPDLQEHVPKFFCVRCDSS